MFPFRPSFARTALAVVTWLFVAASASAQCPIDVMVVLDASGSMRQNDPGRNAIIAVDALAGALTPRDRLGIVVFGTEVVTRGPLSPAAGALTAALGIAHKVAYDQAHTNIPAGIQEAFYELKQNGRAEAKQLVVLLTDGKVDLKGGPAEIEKARAWLLGDLTSQMKRERVAIYAVGFSAGADIALLQQIGERTEGNYYKAEAENLASTFLTVLRDVRIGCLQAAARQVRRNEPREEHRMRRAKPDEEFELESSPKRKKRGKKAEPEEAPPPKASLWWLWTLIGVLVTGLLAWLLLRKKPKAKPKPRPAPEPEPEEVEHHGTMRMKVPCVLHLERDMYASCSWCKKPYCQECLVEIDKKLICKRCHKPEQARPAPRISGPALESDRPRVAINPVPVPVRVQPRVPDPAPEPDTVRAEFEGKENYSEPVLTLLNTRGVSPRVTGQATRDFMNRAPRWPQEAMTPELEALWDAFSRLPQRIRSQFYDEDGNVSPQYIDNYLDVRGMLAKHPVYQIGRNPKQVAERMSDILAAQVEADRMWARSSDLAQQKKLRFDGAVIDLWRLRLVIAEAQIRFLWADMYEKGRYGRLIRAMASESLNSDAKAQTRRPWAVPGGASLQSLNEAFERLNRDQLAPWRQESLSAYALTPEAKKAHFAAREDVPGQLRAMIEAVTPLLPRIDIESLEEEKPTMSMPKGIPPKR